MIFRLRVVRTECLDCVDDVCLFVEGLDHCGVVKLSLLGFFVNYIYLASMCIDNNAVTEPLFIRFGVDKNFFA